jgi:methyl-accepting chemotaxis protein
MNTSLSTISFRAKILLLVLTSCFILGAPTGTIALREFLNSHKSFTESYKKSLFDDFDNHAKSQVELAISILQRLEERYEKGELSLDQAKTIGTDIISNLHFGTNGYVWADTAAGVHVAGKGGVIGQNRYDQQDIKGNYMMREIIKTGMQPGGGYTDYWFPKPGNDKPLPKRAYSTYFKPFDWVIGTGNYVDDLEAMVKKASDENLSRIKHGIYLIVGVTLFILILVSLMAVVVTKMLLRNIGAEPHDMEDIAIRVAEGDLTIRMDDGRSGIYEAMRQMVEGLRQVMEKVNLSSEEVLTSASEVDSYAGNITEESNRVVGQAETVATASEEMSATSNDIANNCHQAAESSNKASTTAQSGAVIVRQTVEGMNRIAEKVRSSAEVVEQLGTRSEQIGVIVGTIEDIADQTNLLALNAAIEAARAGEQGRGFAVVADEVRALAERTTKATHEIGTMIKNIQNETKLAVKSMKDGVIEVEQGTVGAAKSGQALELILEQINDVTSQINQIATAAEEQTATTREITNNIHAISETVQTSARSSQVMSVSSSRLSQLSMELQDIVRRFSL